jgi:hypothetical protein
MEISAFYFFGIFLLEKLFSSKSNKDDTDGIYHDPRFVEYRIGGTATREMGDCLNFAHLPPGRWEMDGVIGRREAGDRLATLRETGDSAKIGLPPNGRWEIYPKSPHLPVGDREILTLCPPLRIG